MIWRKSFVRPPLARRTVVDQLGRAREEAIVADAQQRSARHVADAGRLDDERPRLAAGEALVPGERPPA